MEREPLIGRHGGYRQLKSFQAAQLAYDVTQRFCACYIDRRSRTHDQMVQAARSGVQNIAEGSQASGTSRKMELKLTNVARASLEELRLDYEDFLRQRGLRLWATTEPMRHALVARRCHSADEVVLWIREAHQSLHGGDGLDGQVASDAGRRIGHSAGAPVASDGLAPCHAEIAANAALVLIGVASALLGRQIAAQAAAFERDGGFTERLHWVRQASRREARGGMD